jgi:transcriptional regulator with XRE-family HTH domain
MEDKALTRIKEFCDKRGWTVYRLAKESDISYSTLNNLFNRNNTPSLPTLERICLDGFGISLSQFFADDEYIHTLTDKQQKLLERYCNLPPAEKSLLEAYLTGLEKK